MSIKAEVIPQEKVVEQVKELSSQKEVLEVQIEVLERRLQSLQASIAENDEFKKKNRDSLEQIMKNFGEECRRKAEFYPDIRLEVLTSAAAQNAPPKK